MSKELIEEQAQLYALGTLPVGDRAAFEAKIREDREVQELVHGYQRLSELEARDGELEPPFHAYSRIMASIEEEDAPPGAASAAPPAKSERRTVISFVTWGGWAAAAAVAVAVGLGVFSAGPQSGGASDIVVNNLANPRLVPVQTPSEDFGMEDRMLELAGLAEAYWFSREGVPAGQLLREENTQVEELSGGFTVFDRRHNIGFIAVDNMPTETSGKSFHVWAKTARGKVVRAGTLPIGEESRGLFFFDVASLPDGESLDTVSFFVTEEENESPSAPSQMVVLSDR